MAPDDPAPDAPTPDAPAPAPDDPAPAGPARDFTQVAWDEDLEDDCRQLIRLAVREDLERQQDWTTVSLAPAGSRGAARFQAREAGVTAGMRAAELVIDEMNLQADWTAHVRDGDRLSPGQDLAEIRGAARDLLTAERLMLNLLGRLSGIATLTRQYVDAVAGTPARVYDTRKTTPGWRRLEKQAVACGGGRNHRTGLFDAVLIKDNHLQLARNERPDLPLSEAVRQARQFVRQQGAGDLIVEIEVDTLEQLRDVLPGEPDIVLLDNMTPDTLREAVAIRDQSAPGVQLEASGGVNLQTIRGIAESGVERISVGALTHSARTLDIGLDWNLRGPTA